MADQTLRQYFERRKSAMIQERSSFISHWKELSQFIQPRRGRFLVDDVNKGDKRYSAIINSKATQAHRIARSGLLAGFMSPARPWFQLTTPDPDLMDYAPVKEWLYRVELILREIFNQSNFYQMVPVMLGELLLFATGCMTHVDDFNTVARFYTHTAGSYLIAQDDKFQVNTLVREFKWTTAQCMQAFGQKCSQQIKNAYDKGNYDAWWPLVHFVEQNPEATGGLLSKNKAFRSVYYEPGASGSEDQVLSFAGFDEFPAYCPRWDVTGEDIYGTDCPGMTALGDIKGLQIEEKRKAQAIDKMTNPPLKGPATLRNSPINSLPGGVTLYDGDGSKEGLAPIYQVNPQIGELRIDIQAVEQRIDTAFYVDMFLAITNMAGIQPKNELELNQRNQERLLQLGPVLERLHTEFADQLIDRTFNQCLRAGILPPPPPELSGAALRVNYISTLAMAQRAVATGGIEHLSAFVGSLAAAGFPQVADKFDADQAVDEMAQAIGVPPSLVVPDETVAEVRAQRAQQQQMAEAAAMAESMSSSAKNLGQAKVGGEPTLLSNIIGGNLPS
jgi:hypothetical protein